MSMEREIVRTISGTVAEVGIHKGKPIVKIESPFFQSQYPTAFYGVSEQHRMLLQKAMMAQRPVTLRIKADRQKEDQDGSKPYHFFWSIDDIGDHLDAEASDEAKRESAEQMPMQAQQPAPWENGNGRKDRLIVRQVAWKAAADMVVAGIVAPDDLEGMADAGFRWIMEQEATA